MTTTPPGSGPTQQQAPDDGGPRVTRDEVRDLARLRRTTGGDRYVAGVGGGIARHLDVDPVVVRVLLVVLAFFGGAGLIVYAVAWLVVPEDGRDRARLSLDARSRTVALVGALALGALAVLGDTFAGGWFPWPLALAALIVFLVLSRRDRGEEASAAPPGTWAGSATYLASQPGTATPTTTVPAGAPAGPDGPPPAVWSPPPPPPRPRNPRRRGPRLFPLALALVAFAIGLVGILDVAGLPLAAPAYPAIALGVVAALLLLSSVWGRGGGLIALGLVLAVALGISSAAERVDGDRVLRVPTDAAAVQDTYDNSVGELVLDLSEVSDPDALDGREIQLDGGIGRIEVILPEGVDVELQGSVGGPGAVNLLGDEEGGIDVTRFADLDGGADAPSLLVVASLGVGEIEMRTR